MTTVAHSRLKATVSTHMTTTPAATRRAETSFTGSGNEKSARTRLFSLWVVTLVPMTCSFLEAANPDQISRVLSGRGRAGPRAPGTHSGQGNGTDRGGQARAGGTGCGGGGPT